jgi:hypothetical protein
MEKTTGRASFRYAFAIGAFSNNSRSNIVSLCQNNGYSKYTFDSTYKQDLPAEYNRRIAFCAEVTVHCPAAPQGTAGSEL